jgi:hypothetical protein
MSDSNSEKIGRFCDDLGSNIMHYSVGPIFTHHGRITASEYVDRLSNQVHPMIQTLVPNNNALFQDVSAPIHTAGHGLKSVKVNFNIIPDQHNDHI